MGSSEFSQRPGSVWLSLIFSQIRCPVLPAARPYQFAKEVVNI